MKISQRQRNAFAEQRRVDEELNRLLYSDEEFDKMCIEAQRRTIEQLNLILNHVFKEEK